MTAAREAEMALKGKKPAKKARAKSAPMFSRALLNCSPPEPWRQHVENSESPAERIDVLAAPAQPPSPAVATHPPVADVGGEVVMPIDIADLTPAPWAFGGGYGLQGVEIVGNNGARRVCGIPHVQKELRDPDGRKTGSEPVLYGWADGRLIIEARAVVDETGLTPRQLQREHAQQAAELAAVAGVLDLANVPGKSVEGRVAALVSERAALIDGLHAVADSLRAEGFHDGHQVMEDIDDLLHVDAESSPHAELGELVNELREAHEATEEAERRIAALVAERDALRARVADAELTTISDWLYFAAEPVGQTCCGRAGPECCGNPDVVYRTEREVLDAMATRHRELTEQLQQGTPSPDPRLAEVDGLKKRATEIRGMVEGLIDFLEPPHARCTCFASSPCDDCTEFGAIRESIATLRAALAATGSER